MVCWNLNFFSIEPSNGRKTKPKIDDNNVKFRFEFSYDLGVLEVKKTFAANIATWTFVYVLLFMY